MQFIRGKILEALICFDCLSQVLACSMLRVLPQFKDAEIVRSRDPAVLDACDIVVDVGAVYDHSKLRYDHHQKTFTDCMKTVVPGKTWETKLSSGTPISWLQ